MSRTAVFRWTTLAGYFGLLITLMSWFIWVAPPTRLPVGLLLLVLVVPLLLPLRGLLHARRYTHQWMSFFSLLYFAIGVDSWYTLTGPARLMSVLTVVFSLVLFTGCVCFARFVAREPLAR